MKTAMICLAILCLVTSILVIPQIRIVVMDPIVEAILNHANYIEIVMGR
jgi:multicomponent Na+:H+ antiporter subunit D